MGTRWTSAEAAAWAEGMPWLVGCNYTPRTASNQLETWQAETFAPETIDEELGWAAGLGMNSIRLFLHDLPWQEDAAAFRSRIDAVLGIAARHGIGVMLVLFDSCWHPFPHPGPQGEPEPGVHNSRWVQSPGVAALRDGAAFDRLEDYVTGVIEHFRDDRRVQIWDLWNEPTNANAGSYGPRDLGEAKAALVEPLLRKVFAWARAAKPTQPLTSGVWAYPSAPAYLHAFEPLQIELSDVISFHSYAPPKELAARIAELAVHQRPLLCTEYLARGNGSTVEGCLPVFREQRVGAYNWGLVDGRTQTKYPWSSWQAPCTDGEPEPWHHELLRADGSPYRPEEAAALRSATSTGRQS